MTRKTLITLVGVAGSCKGVTYRVEASVVTIGSAKGCDFTVTGRLVSDVHATLDVGSDGRVTLRNRSAHGTFVNRESVDVRQVQAGDRIQIGEGGIVEVRFGKEVGSAGNGGGPSTKKKIVAVLVGVYVLAMVGLMVFLSMQPKVPTAVSGETITAALEKTRSQLLDKSWWRGHDGPVAPPQSISELDPSGSYYAIQSLVASGAPAEQISAMTDALLQHLQELFQDGRMLEQRERWKDARIRYHQIIEAAPDARLEIAHLAEERLGKLDRLGQNAN